jgi:hypothetical protein
VSVQARLRLVPINDLSDSEGWVDATSESVQPFGNVGDAPRLRLPIIEGPSVEEGHFRGYQHGALDFGDTDFADASGITANCVEVVIRHEIRRGWRCEFRRRGDVRRIERLKPSESGVVVALHVFCIAAPPPAVGAGD